jgi:hypothetical protein
MTLATLTDTQVKIIIACLGAAATILAVFITAALSRWSQATNRRRDHYASAVETLEAWSEYPYCVRRRTSDTPEELGRLANLGHDLQQQLRCHETWIATESRFVARAFREALEDITALVGPATKDAWNTGPITRAADMNLNGWGPGRETTPHVDRLRSAIACRFGWRRLARPFHFGVQRRDQH